MFAGQDQWLKEAPTKVQEALGFKSYLNVDIMLVLIIWKQVAHAVTDKSLGLVFVYKPKGPRFSVLYKNLDPGASRARL